MTKQPQKDEGRIRKYAPALVAGLAAVLLVSIVLASRVDREVDLSGVAIDSIGTPQMQLDRDFVDFGDVSFNQMVEATFELHNSGDATLLFVEEPFIELKDGC